MPRPHKPAELLILTGHYRPDRHARRRAAPKSPHPIIDPPASMAEDERACWQEFVADAAAGVLTGYDRWALERLCCLQAKARREGLSNGELGHLRGFLTELGASPASRGWVQPAGAAEPAGGNPWDVAPPGRA